MLLLLLLLLFSCSLLLKQLVCVLRSDSGRSSSAGGFSASVQKPFISSAMEDLNRTWPSASVADASVKDTRLRSAISVSAAKSHFEQMSKSR